MDNFIKTGCDFIKYHTTFDSKYYEVLGALTHMYNSNELTDNQKKDIKEAIVIANYGDPGLDQNYQADILNYYLHQLLYSDLYLDQKPFVMWLIVLMQLG